MTPDASIPQDIRDELDKTPAWWDREYRALLRKVFPPKPFNPADHEGHNIVEIRSYASRVVRRICADCGDDDD